MNSDTDRSVAIKLNHLSPTWVRMLDEEVGRRGMFCDIKAVFRGLCRPITQLTEELRLRKTND